MAEGSQRRFSQVWFFSTPTNPERTRLKHLNVLWKSIFLIPQLPSLCSGGLVVDGTVDCKDNKEKMTREVADIMMYHFSWNVLQLGCDMLWWRWLTEPFFVFQTCGTTFRSCVLRVDDTVDGKDNLMEETVGVGVLLSVLLLFQWARVVPETSGLPEISGNTRCFGLPATRWFLKLNRVGSGIERNTG